MAIQVVNTAGNVVWTSDKAAIAANSTDVTYQVFATALGSASAVGNLYANVVAVPAGTVQEIYVGVGNRLILAGSNVTATALGTTTSAQSSVFNAAGT